MTKSKTLKIISAVMCFMVIFSCTQVCATEISQPNAKGDTVKVKFPIAFFRSEPNLSLNAIKGIYLYGKEVKVLGYSGQYVYVQDSKSKDNGYIHELLLNDKPLNIKQQYVDVYSGALREGILTINHDKDGALEWSVSKSGIVEITKYSDRSLSVKGISPGTVTLTVECNGYKDTCDIACIEQWSDTETATAQTSITVMGTPGNKYKGAKTIPEGATITARGNIPSNSDYVYVSSGDIWGFINLSDFSAIKYMMTQYHYYDEGYKERFSSASTKIADYASVLNDVMMSNFKLKVCSYVKPYTSPADQCKKWKYGDDYLDYLSGSCTKISPHKTDSCLQTGYLRDDLKKQFGNGGGTVSKVAWTGHIMTNYETDRSNATVGIGTVIITPYATTNPNNNFSNYSSDRIRRESLYTIVHETGHQLNLRDHYCKKDFSEQTGKCTNEFCVTCNKLPYSDDCIMLDRINVETVNTSKIYCDYCKNTINIYLSDNF